MSRNLCSWQITSSNMLPNVAETGIFCNDPAIYVAKKFKPHSTHSLHERLYCHIPLGEPQSLTSRGNSINYLSERLYCFICQGETLSSYISREDFIIIYLKGRLYHHIPLGETLSGRWGEEATPYSKAWGSDDTERSLF